MLEGLLAVVAVLLTACLGVLGVLLHRSGSATGLPERLERLERGEERTERAVREEIAKNREEAVGSARHLREELAASLHRLAQTVDGRFQQLDATTGKRLEAIQSTVDEKLEGTLEKRLGEAFQQVSERLEAVHKGLGEMQSLAVGVGDLKKVLSNVKTRGSFGELQLGALLEQVLSPGQYEREVATRPQSSERVDYAIRLPGADGRDGSPVWLPIDAKFPQDDYERLLDAHERGDAAAAEEAGRALEARIKAQARSIQDKYVCPPATTDFAVLFLPTEGLYAEVLRRPGLVDHLQREQRVSIAGPTTLAAFLNSLQLGFRTLAIQQHSDEVWNLLGAVRTQFRKFGELLAKVDKKLHEASNTIGLASRKTRTIERHLGRVETLPEEQARALLPGLDAADDPD